MFFGTLSKCSIFQYCESNIELFSFAPHLAIALPTLRYSKVVDLNIFALFCIGFIVWFMASFPYCSPCYHSFSILKALAKIKENLSLSPTRERMNNNYRNSCKSDNYKKGNEGKKQRILRVITLQGAIEKSSILLSKYWKNY